MKKISILFAFMSAAWISNAQTWSFNVNLTEPTNGQTLTQGTAFDQKFIITNLGPSTISPGDTIAYVDPSAPQGQVFIRTNYTKGVGDTIQINKSLNITGGTSQTGVNYCVVAFMFANGAIRPGFDTTGFRSCKTVNIVTTPSSVGDLTFSETQPLGKLGIYPNPASTKQVSLDFVAPTDGEVSAELFDITGRKIYSHHYGKQFKGQAGFQLPVDAVQQGLYIVEIRQGSYRYSGRLIKE